MANTGYIGVGPADRDPTVSDDSVTTAKIQNNAVTGAKIAMTSDAAGDILTYTGTDYARLGIGTATQVLKVNAGATAVEWAADSVNAGDVVGPGSATDDALAKFNLTTGKLIQNSNATLTDAGVLTVANIAATIDTAAQPTITSLGTIASLVATTADINAGTVDAVIGGTTPAAGTFTTVTGNTSVTTAQVDITAQGDLRLQDTTGGEYVGFQAAGTTTTYTLTMPAAVATTTGQALTSSTGGVGSWTDVGDALLAADQTWSGSQRGTLVTDNDGSFDLDGGNNFFCTPAAAVTLTFTNHTSGQSGYILFANTGGNTVSLAGTTKGDANLTSTLSTAGTYLVSYLDNGTNAYLTTSAVFA